MPVDASFPVQQKPEASPESGDVDTQKTVNAQGLYTYVQTVKDSNSDAIRRFLDDMYFEQRNLVIYGIDEHNMGDHSQH